MRKTRTVQALLLAVVAATVNATPAAGQVRLFDWPDTAVDVSTYTTVEQCVVAVERVQVSATVHEIQTTHVVPDTLPYDPDRVERPAPSAVRETASTCLNAAAAHADTLGDDAWEMLVSLYLQAGWDDSARALVDRRVAAIEPDRTDELRGLLVHVVSKLFMKAQPPRHELAAEFVQEHVEKLPTIMDRFPVYGALLQYYMQLTHGNLNQDSEAGAHGRRLLARFKAGLQSMPEDELQRLVDASGNVSATPEQFIEQMEAQLMALLGRSFMWDLLRVSTEAYTKAALQAQSKGFGTTSSPLLGKVAPRLEGDVWLGCEQDPCETYPRQGRITLVWFFDDHQCSDYLLRVSRDPCKSRISLRRLQNRFPELDIVVVAQSSGMYAYLKEGMTPEREAQLIRKWLDTFGLDRAVLTMTETQGWRLPEPDGRWAVRRPTANWQNYSNPSLPFFLIDQDGYVTHINNMSRMSQLDAEQEFTKLIEILMERGGSAT